MPPGPAPPRAPSTTTVEVASGRNPTRPAEARAADHTLGGAQRSARRGVPLGLVVEFDDLGALEPRGGQRREPHHQDGADGEVGGHDAVGAVRRPGCEQLGQVVEVVLGEPGGPDHGVNPGRSAVGQRGLRDLEVGEVHDHIDIGRGQCGHVRGDDHRLGRRAGRADQVGHGRPGVAGVDGGGQFETGPLQHRAAHLTPHPPTSTDDPDSHVGHPSQGVVNPGRAPRRRSPTRRTCPPPTGCGGRPPLPGRRRGCHRG